MAPLGGRRGCGTVIDDTLQAFAAVGAPATWVLSNHDVTRHLTRYGPADTGRRQRAPRRGPSPTDLELGTRRARAAALLTLALPGSAYVYQGDELGLREVEDIPEDRLPGSDLGAIRAPPARPGRLPGAAAVVRGRAALRVQHRHAVAAAARRLAAHTAEAEAGDPASMLTLYRTALRLRREHPALGDGTLTWLPAPPGVLSFAREPGFLCVVNQSAVPVELPPHSEVLLTSGPLSGSELPSDTAAWLRR